MHEAERIRVLAEKWYPSPPAHPPTEANSSAWGDWHRWWSNFERLLNIGTDGALLGAAVDLFDFALAPKGWHRSNSYHTSCDGEAIYVATLKRHEGEPEDPPHTIRSTGYVSDAAALIAAMEEVI